jgi:hypothetical protein
MIRVNNTIINVLIGVIIGFFLSFILSPFGSSANLPKFQYLQALIFDNNTIQHHHDAHSELELDESHVPDSPLHFHVNGSKFHKHGKISIKIINIKSKVATKSNASNL